MWSRTLQRRYDRVKGTDPKISAPICRWAPIHERQYSAIVYGKAALFFNAIYDEIGDEKFNQLLQDYFKQYRYGVAYPQDFLNSGRSMWARRSWMNW